ncbi:hypothetical protein [Actinomadura rugatobispora]|uniref:Winged helix DNA-binding domain-containing protein n=1 Tax=Actinomadura rugatobispora TaxID=1994 RepID=A0ABW0ZXP5_9ACTN|nr:hypothetical protein GCM10010200_007700 [Actinomadura rugatobispora]
MNDVLYPPSRALEHAADLPGVRPLRIHRIGVPLFEVEIDALVHDAQPYDLLDRFVGRALADAELRSPAEIADFLGLALPMVDRVLRFLGNVGHLTTAPDGTLVLTDLGRRSVQDDRRYVPKRDRQKLYFDGVRGEALPAVHYSRSVTVLRRDEATDQKLFRLPKACAFRNDAVHALAARPDRTAYNLLSDFLEVTPVAVDDAHLPCYLVRTQTPRGLDLLAYSGIPGLRDEHLERLLRGWPLIGQQLAVDDANHQGDPRDEFGDWLREQGLDPDLLRWVDQPPRLRLTLPASRFHDVRPNTPRRGTFGLTQVGSFTAPRGQVLQLWCDDERLRRDAAYARGLLYATSSRTRQADEVTELLDRICRQLEIAPLTLADLRRHARTAGHPDLPF